MQNDKLKSSSKTEKELWDWLLFFKMLLPPAFIFHLISSIFWCWKNTQDQSQNKERAGPNDMLSTFGNKKSQEFGFAVSFGGWKAYSYSLGVFPN